MKLEKTGKTATWNWPKSGVKKLACPRCSRGLGETTRERVCRAVFVRRIRKKRVMGPEKVEIQKSDFFRGRKVQKYEGLTDVRAPPAQEGQRNLKKTRQKTSLKRALNG